MVFRKIFYKAGPNWRLKLTGVLDHVFSLVYLSLIWVWSASWFLEAFVPTANLASTVACLHFTSCECANVYLCGVMWPLGRSGRPGDAAAGRRSWHQHHQHHQKLHQIAQITTARAPRPSTAQHGKHTRARYHLLKGLPCPPQLPASNNFTQKCHPLEPIIRFKSYFSHFVYVYPSLFI